MLIDQHDLHATDRGAHGRIDLGGRGFDERRQPSRDRLFALVVMDIEAAGRNRLEPQPRIVPGRRVGDAAGRPAAATDQRQHGRGARPLTADAAGTRRTSFRNAKSAMGDSDTPSMIRLEDRDVGAIPQRQIRHIGSDDALRAAVERLALVFDLRRRGRVNQPIDFGIHVVDAVEADRRLLRRMEDPAEHVRIGHADEHRGVELEIAADDVGEERLRFRRPHVEADADVREVVLDRRGLQRGRSRRSTCGSSASGAWPARRRRDRAVPRRRADASPRLDRGGRRTPPARTPTTSAARCRPPTCRARGEGTRQSPRD